MKIKFIDKNKSLVNKVKKLGMFECFCDDILNYEGVIVTASNPDFTMLGGLDKAIFDKYPEICKKKQEKKGGNEKIDNIMFCVTVDENIKSSKELIRKSLQSIRMMCGEADTILLSGLGTGIGGLSENDFVDVLKDFFSKKGYKAFDDGLTCRGHKFKIGEIYNECNYELCNVGYHYCEKLEDVYKYYNNPKHICEVEACGYIDFGVDKNCTQKIKIIREMSDYDIITQKSKYNAGNWNTGYRNTGNRNTGNRNTGNRNAGNWNYGNGNSGDRNSGNENSGNWNSGDRNSGNENSGNGNSGNGNSGDRNSGNWNSGDRNSGDLNTISQPYMIFNKKSKTNKEDIQFPAYFFFDVNIEKKDSQRTYTMQEAWLISFNNASKEDVKKTLKLPNFDYEIFEEISGITKKMIEDKIK